MGWSSWRRVFLIEPFAVELHSRAKGTSKRRPNLTYEELEKLAEASGVQDLYHHAAAAFARHLQRHTTRSTIGFAAVFDGGRKNVVSLLPGESSITDGLRYQLYKNRFAALSVLTEAEVEALMPESHDHWVYSLTGGSDWEGFQGYIKTREEVDRLADALSGNKRVT